MKLTSTAFENNRVIAAKYTCAGAGVNPPLGIRGAPAGTGALALVVDDPDAPGGTFDHWVMWNLPAGLLEVPEDWAVPASASVGANGVGKSAWYAPCPPSGTHHYYFRLYALDQKLELAAGSSKAALDSAMEGHIVEQAELVGTVTAGR